MTRPAQTEELGRLVPMVSRQILSVLTGRLVTPLLRSVESLRKVATPAEEGERLALGEESI
ncbi:hypothetical protein FRC10_004977, partial [Ceratobasidium sp. 414]